MVEKQASSEIAQSRTQFEKRGNEKAWNLTRRPDGSYDNAFTAYRWDDWQISWQAAERDTRERCAQIADDEATKLERNAEKRPTAAVELLTEATTFRRVAERIRGKE